MDNNFLRSIIEKANLGEELTISKVNENEPLVMVNPTGVCNIDIEESAEIIIIHCNESSSELKLNVCKNTKVSLIDIYIAPSNSMLNIDLEQDSACNISAYDFAGAHTKYNIDLTKQGGDAELNILQLTTAKDHSVSNIAIRHSASDCTSRSLGKCVASGDSVAEFHGMVYVAKDAQRTSSEQNSRNIQLSNGAKIIAEPQLEIYADDVKCTHGATVGQMNEEAIFYMRQRGLSEESAQKLHLEGFVEDIVNRCSIAQFTDELKVMVEQRLQHI